MDKGLTMKQGFARALEDYRKIGDAEMIAFFEKRLEQANKKATTERKLTPTSRKMRKSRKESLTIWKLLCATPLQICLLRLIASPKR